MKVTSPIIAICAALATLTLTPEITATPIRIIDASSLIGTPFDPNAHPRPPSHHHAHSHGVPVKLDAEAEAEKTVKGWMDFFEKYALGVTGIRKDGDGEGEGETRYGSWREGKVIRPGPGTWDKTGPGYVHKAKTQIEDELPGGHHYHHHHNYHPESSNPNSSPEPEAFHILPRPPHPPHIHNSPSESDPLSLPHTGVPDDDWKSMLVQAGIIHPEEAGPGVIVRPVPVGVGMYRGKWYGQGYGHGYGASGPGGGYAGERGTSRCFFGRLSHAINSLQPLESFLISFIFGMGLASLLRIVYMIGLLIKRSHQFINEVPALAAVVEEEGRGYPGAEARREREREGRGRGEEGEREELLPAYTEKVEEAEMEAEEKVDRQ